MQVGRRSLKWRRRQLTRKLVTASAFLPPRSFAVRQCRAFRQVAIAVVKYLKWHAMEGMLASNRLYGRRRVKS